MSDDNADAPTSDTSDTASNGLTYADALVAAQPRIAELGVRMSALADQVLAVWQEVEPALRAWVVRADMLTEQQWMDEPESTRAFYDTWKQWFAAQDTPAEGEM